MAIDHWLLERGEPALRLYTWARPTLSLGFHQRRVPRRWLDLAAAGRVDLVRRPSGGQAVLHGGDLTYALVWPDPPSERKRAYEVACAWLCQAFAELGEPLRFGTTPASLAGSNCFASSTAADLIQADGSKRIGSAQLWRGGRVLQHGSIQLAVDAALWQELFQSEPPALPPLAVSPQQLETSLLTAASQWLPLPPAVPRPLLAAELAELAGRLEHYRVGGVVSSPEASIVRTT